jgi:hypothetical protein
MALAKILRKSSGYLNKRDEAALEDLLQNFKLYLVSSMSILDQVSRIYKRQSDLIAQEEDQAEMHTQLHNVTMEVLEQCGVSNR